MLAVLVLMLAWGPSTASAKTFFAAQADTGLGDCSSAANACDLDDALTAANADATDPRDTVQVVGPLTRDATLSLTASPIDLVGSGQGAGGTLIENLVAPTKLLLGQGSTAANLRVRSVSSAPVQMEHGTQARDITAETTAPGAAISVEGGAGAESALERVTAIGGDATGVAVAHSGGSVARIVDSTLTGRIGLSSAGTSGTTIVQRAAIDASELGMRLATSTGGTHVIASSSTIRLRAGTGPPDAAIGVTGGIAPGTDTSAALRQLTIDGTAATGDGGVEAGSGGAGTANVTLASSIVRGFDADLRTDTANARIEVGTSSFSTTSATAGVVDTTTLGGNVDLDPQYVDPLALDFRLRPTSPLIDLGGTAPLATEESLTDFAGSSRILDGNANGLPERDMGAFESPAIAPPQSLPGCPQGKNLIELGPGDDSQNGTLAGDLIFAGAGNDVIDALAGDDCVDLGQGDDRGEGGSGADLMLGAQGGDTVSGGSEDDNLTGAEGADRLDGGAGNDQALGGSENDRILGGFGDDTLHGESENDRVEGSRGRDRLNGGTGNDRLVGGSGDDQLNGDAGGDNLAGGSGNDRLRGNAGGDRISGGSGRDRISGDAGRDRISARGGGRDRISCGRGRDTALVDRRDRVARNCERVRRRR